MTVCLRIENSSNPLGVGRCVCVCGGGVVCCVLCVSACSHVPFGQGNTRSTNTQSQRLLCSFHSALKEKCDGEEINKSRVMLVVQVLFFSFLPLMAREVFHHVPLISLFAQFCSGTLRDTMLMGAICSPLYPFSLACSCFQLSVFVVLSPLPQGLPSFCTGGFSLDQNIFTLEIPETFCI